MPPAASTTSSGVRDCGGVFAACGDGQLIDEVARLLEVLDPDLQIVLLAARPIQCGPRRSGGSSATGCGGTC